MSLSVILPDPQTPDPIKFRVAKPQVMPLANKILGRPADGEIKTEAPSRYPFLDGWFASSLVVQRHADSCLLEIEVTFSKPTLSIET